MPTHLPIRALGASAALTGDSSQLTGGEDSHLLPVPLVDRVIIWAVLWLAGAAVLYVPLKLMGGV